MLGSGVALAAVLLRAQVLLVESFAAALALTIVLFVAALLAFLFAAPVAGRGRGGGVGAGLGFLGKRAHGDALESRTRRTSCDAMEGTIQAE